jgi:hypothetical protein
VSEHEAVLTFANSARARASTRRLVRVETQCVTAGTLLSCEADGVGMTVSNRTGEPRNSTQRILGAERRMRILELLGERRPVRTSSLSRLFDVTEMTIRRDLALLESYDLLVRSHGGAMARRGRS